MVRWPLQPLQPLQKTQLQPPFGPSVGSLCHPWVTTTNPSYRFPIFETSATALCGTTGININIKIYIYIYIYIHITTYIAICVCIYIYIRINNLIMITQVDLLVDLSADPCGCHCRGKRPRQRSISSGLFSFTCQFRSSAPRPAALRKGTISPAVPCCFGVVKRTFLNLLAGLWTLFYRRFKEQMDHDLAALREAFRPSLPCC